MQLLVHDMEDQAGIPQKVLFSLCFATLAVVKRGNGLCVGRAGSKLVLLPLEVDVGEASI